MIFSTLEHILTHISFSVISIVISIHLITILVNEIVGLYDLSKKAMMITFFCVTGLLITRWFFSGHLPFSDLYESLIFLSWGFSIFHKGEKPFKYNNRTKCYFYPRLYDFGSFNQNASICNISTRSTIPLANDARKYDDIGLCSSFMILGYTHITLLSLQPCCKALTIVTLHLVV